MIDTSFSSFTERLLVSISVSISSIRAVKFSTEPDSRFGHLAIALWMFAFSSFSVFYAIRGEGRENTRTSFFSFINSSLLLRREVMTELSI